MNGFPVNNSGMKENRVSITVILNQDQYRVIRIIRLFVIFVRNAMNQSSPLKKLKSKYWKDYDKLLKLYTGGTGQETS